MNLYLYPGMFGLEDNNPFGLKVVAFLQMHKIPFNPIHTVDTTNAPRNQLPYLEDDQNIISDSNEMLAYITQKYDIKTEQSLSPQQKAVDLLLRRTLDENLYWIMSYSRWQDPHFWPQFQAAFLAQFPDVTREQLENSREYNIRKYHIQGIGRYQPTAIYQKGIDNLKALNELLKVPYFFGETPHSIDACIYGFLANSYYFPILTPLKQYIDSQSSLVEYIKRMYQLTH